MNCYAAGDVVSRKTTTDAGILSGRSSGINIDYHCYYHPEAALQQGDTVISPAAAVASSPPTQRRWTSPARPRQS